jgi:hypothetical protein
VRKPDIATGEEEESIQTHFEAFSANYKSPVFALKLRERRLLVKHKESWAADSREL